MVTKVGKQHYVYVAYYRGIIVYVGKGKDDRYKHTFTGQSNNELINDFYFRSKLLGDLPVDVVKIRYYYTDEEALKGEKFLIKKHLPYCNKCSGRKHEEVYDFKDKLKQLCDDLGYETPENLQSKFDFRFLFTPKGLLCKDVDLRDNSPFEYAQEGFHIRIKKELFQYFPEYALMFSSKPYPMTGSLLPCFHTSEVYNRFVERGNNPFDYLGLDIHWAIQALKSGSFDFIPKNKDVTYYREVDAEKSVYNYYLQESHVELYKKRINLLNNAKVEKSIRSIEKKTRDNADKVKRVIFNDMEFNPKLRVWDNPLLTINSTFILGKFKSSGFSTSNCKEQSKYLVLTPKNKLMTIDVKLSSYVFYHIE